MELYVVIEENEDDGKVPALVTNSLDKALEYMRNSFIEYVKHGGNRCNITWDEGGNNYHWGWFDSTIARGCEVYSKPIEGEMCPNSVYVIMDGDTIRRYVDTVFSKEEVRATMFDTLREFISSGESDRSIEFDGNLDENQSSYECWYSSGSGVDGCYGYFMIVVGTIGNEVK